MVEKKSGGRGGKKKSLTNPKNPPSTIFCHFCTLFRSLLSQFSFYVERAIGRCTQSLAGRKRLKKAFKNSHSQNFENAKQNGTAMATAAARGREEVQKHIATKRVQASHFPTHPKALVVVSCAISLTLATFRVHRPMQQTPLCGKSAPEKKSFLEADFTFANSETQTLGKTLPGRRGFFF